MLLTDFLSSPISCIDHHLGPSAVINAIDSESRAIWEEGKIVQNPHDRPSNRTAELP